MAKFKVGDKVKILDGSGINNYSGGWNDYMSEQIGKISEVIEVLELMFPDKVAYRLKDLYCFWDERGLSYANNSMDIWFENGSYIEALPAGIGVCRSTRGLSAYEYLQKVSDKYRKVEKKVAREFMFNVKEGTRIDKTCNKLIPTMTTFITANSYGDTIHGAATCDKTDYSERQGCLEALANSVLGGNFDREFNKAVKANALADKKSRTCTYCGKVFDTVDEREAEEAWHVERKKARRDRYLLRKRAKEIAFEEQAQKMAKEIIADEGRKKT